VTDPEDLRRALAAASADPCPGASGEEPATALVRLCRAVASLLGADGAAAVGSGTPEGGVAAATGPVGALLTELEELVGDGPGTRALAAPQSLTVRLGDAARPSGIPALDVAAAEVGLPAVVVRAWPIRSSARCVGALVVHTVLPPSPVPTPRRSEEPVPQGVAAVVEEDGQVLADALAPAVRAVAPDPDGAADRLDRAVGMVVAQTGLPPEDARALLRARAWADGQRLADAAAAVLERRTRLADGDGPA